MRLIEAPTLELIDFAEGCIPPYACLSHRWSNEEVSFQQWQNRTPEIEAHAGYIKVVQACEVAQGHGINYLWADTCCIDKTSSAELSEAINSMWTWYLNSTLCLAYLADIDGDQQRGSDGYVEKLDKSEWFTRAWTLQELLAPSTVLFYDSRWRFLGTKHNLVRDIQAHTDIHLKALTDFRHSDWSIAQRMSWASTRKATRTEDIAYSLLGIFDINMPMLYGEGKKAFFRLQEEIIRHSIDTSILAWDASLAPPDTDKRTLLAPTPVCFKNGRSRTGLFSQLQDLPNAAHLSVIATSTITNLGLDVTLPLSPWDGSERRALIAFESPHRDLSQGLHRRGCFLCLDRVRENILQRKPIELYSRFLSAPDLPSSEEFNLEWSKITIAAQPYQRIGLAQDRFRLEPYMRRTGPDCNVWSAKRDRVDQRPFLDWGVLVTNGSSPFETLGVWLSEDVESTEKSSYTVQFGFESGHSPMAFICCTSKSIDELRADITAGTGSFFTSDWMQTDIQMTQHESKAFSSADWSTDGSYGVILDFYSRKKFRINWKAVELELEPLLEDETGLEWSLGVRNTLTATSDEVLRTVVRQHEVESVLRPQQSGLLGILRQFISR